MVGKQKTLIVVGAAIIILLLVALLYFYKPDEDGVSGGGNGGGGETDEGIDLPNTNTEVVNDDPGLWEQLPELTEDEPEQISIPSAGSMAGHAVSHFVGRPMPVTVV